MSTLEFFVDSHTNVRIASRVQGVYNAQNDLIGIVNDWDKENRSLIDRNDEVIIRIPEDAIINENEDEYGNPIINIYGLPDGQQLQIRDLTERESEIHDQQIQEENRERMA